MKRSVKTISWTSLLCGAMLIFGACSQEKKTEETNTTTTTTQDSAAHAGHDMESQQANKMMDHMHENMQDMQQVKLTGNVDYDFAKLMAAHHKGAIAMAEEQVDKGKDTMLVNMARKNIEMNKKERNELEKYSDQIKDPKGDTAVSAKLMAPMKMMMDDMKHDMQGTTDHHFASMMSMHHQSGIEMADAYLKNNPKSAEIKKIAQKTKDEQQKDKQKLDSWLQKNQQ